MVAMSRSRLFLVSVKSRAMRSRVRLAALTRSSSISFRLLASAGGFFLGAICGVRKDG